MSRRTTTARFSLAAALIAALSLTGAAAGSTAAGEPDGLYSASNGDGVGGFVQLDKTDATATTLGSPVEGVALTSVEVVNGLGYAIGEVLETGTFAFWTWDIATGAVLSSVPISSPAGVIEGMWALDTTPDGLFLTYAVFTYPEVDDPWISSIDPATGSLTPLVNTYSVDDGRLFEGIATNPVNGVTYALADYNDGIPAYSPVDLAAGTVGDSISFPEIYDNLGFGYFSEGDFDATGVLWFTYSGEPGSVARTNGPAEVGVDATELGTPDILSKAITVGQTAVFPVVPAAPQLAATGFPVAPFAGGAAALLIAGLGLMVVRRRAAA